MPKKFPKSLQHYIAKIKKPTAPHISTTLSSSKSWILSGCKHHTKTLSFALDHKEEDQAHDQDDSSATLSDIDRFLFENFKSLYIKDNEDEENGNKNGGGVDKERHENDGIVFESPRLVDPPPDLRGSHRFFVAPGLSSSLIEETRISLTSNGISEFDAAGSIGSSSSVLTTVSNSTPSSNRCDDEAKDAKDVTLPDDCIALLTCSPRPHDDFRRSMHEMVEARLRHHEKVDWSFMEELLFSYLNLNEKKSHKYILSAFVDLIVVLRQKSNWVPARTSRNVRSKRERRKKIRHIKEVKFYM